MNVETHTALIEEEVYIVSKISKSAQIISALKKDKFLYILLIPGVLYYLIFKFAPMWGILISFKDYSPYVGFWNSPWIGFENFTNFFMNPDFFRLIKNTLLLSFYNIVFAFPFPIIMALLLNEIRTKKFKKIVQTLIYVPHFLSWVIIGSITLVLCNTQDGAISQLLFRLVGHKIDLLADPNWFRPLIIVQDMWKDCGFNTILFLAALSGVDVEQYEAAIIDGANRFKQLIHITLPSLKSIIVTLFILRMGTVLDNGFDHIFIMTNALNRNVADVFDTYVYTLGITQGAFSYSTTVGLFKSIVGLILIQSTNFISKKFGETSLF